MHYTGKQNPLRSEWLDHLKMIAAPPLQALAAGQLRASMPLEGVPGREAQSAKVSHLEALARTLVGIAPWLSLTDVPESEREMQLQFRQTSRAAITAALDPDSPDLLNFDAERQALVDAAFLAHALLRCPEELFTKLDAVTQTRLMLALRSSRKIRPGLNNWQMFSAMVEAALFRFTGEADFEPVEVALRHHESWYVGDGAYGDGPEFHWDYYNSYVIQPMLLDVLETLGSQKPEWTEMLPKVQQRAQRYANVQERMVAPDGSFPVVGRSIAYRGGAFQLLAQMVLRNALPESVSPAQARGALTAVLRRTLDAPDTFDANGWLRIGLAGHQPGLGEGYISTGSLYLCSTILLPLGLPVESPFWSQPDELWTNAAIWSGKNAAVDHAL